MLANWPLLVAWWRHVRPRQAAFGCRWSGDKLHADVNAPRNLVARRSVSKANCRRRKKEVLNDSVRRFLERVNRP